MALGLLAALGLHGLLFAAAGRLWRPGPLPVGPRVTKPLEMRMLDESAWRAQLDASATAVGAQPLEARVVHGEPPLPNWPQASAARERSIANAARFPAAHSTPIEQSTQSTRAHPRERLSATPLAPLEDQTAAQSEAPQPNAASDAPADAQPVSISAGSALVLSRPELRYPGRPLRRGIEGMVRVAVEVAADGTVARAWVIRSAGNRELDRSALRYLRGWRFDIQALRRAGPGRLFRSDVRFEIE